MPRLNAVSVLFISSLLICVSLQCEYEHCPHPSRAGKYIKHTMCQYPSGPSAQCTNVIQEHLNASEPTMLLNLHNEFRRKVASGAENRGLRGRHQPAGNITDLQWDEKLAEIAQRWADQCLFENDVCRNFSGFSIGQSVGFTSSPFKMCSFSEVVEEWYEEVKKFDPELISNYQQQRRGLTDHYTQIIWANTTHVGCGGVQYKNTRGRFTAHLVCNYRTKGNIQGEAVYDIHPQL